MDQNISEDILETCSQYKATYCNGCNHAHIWTKQNQNNFQRLFGCPMYGTFNLNVSGEVEDLNPAIIDGDYEYYLAKITKEDQSLYCWYIRWRRRNVKKTKLELFTKQRIPDHFKFGEVGIELLTRWQNEKCDQWIANNETVLKNSNWPGTALSESVWSSMNDHYSGKKVLVHNSGLGYFAFQASKCGSRVTAITQDNSIELATTINNHIEMQDVHFVSDNPNPTLHWDYIFSLHNEFVEQVDSRRLAEYVRFLRLRSDIAIVQIMLDEKRYSYQQQIDSIMNGVELIRYTHPDYGLLGVYRLVSY